MNESMHARITRYSSFKIQFFKLFMQDIISSFIKNIEFDIFHTKIKQNLEGFLTHNSLTQSLILSNINLTEKELVFFRLSRI